MLLAETAFVRFVGLTRIPLLLFIGPQVLRLEEEICEIKIPLGYRTKNHLGSMYLGTLAAGADIAAGITVLKLIREGHPKVMPIFKNMKAEFFKRADGDVVFRTTQGREIADAVKQADASGERVTVEVEVLCTVPKKYGDEPVAKFVMGLSMKRK
ncbi:MAG: DUF4442 domain-containing protein [Myxococcaceae bacterium]